MFIFTLGETGTPEGRARQAATHNPPKANLGAAIGVAALGPIFSSKNAGIIVTSPGNAMVTMQNNKMR